MTTPSRARQSGIPGRTSSIPTPGRPRSSSNVRTNQTTDEISMSRAFIDAVKANDPSQHRNSQLASATTATSLSPQSVVYSGRRSVAGRMPSGASSSSKMQERAKTPVSSRLLSRPPSRQSDLVKPIKKFEVGEHVRIESLGFEGVLRYVGEIDGKSGLWAGVELSGGFFGKGKNNGSVGGKRYFSCPDNCGVFVAIVKLSPPTVGPGAVVRPPSVASHRSTIPMGRTTPSVFNSSRISSTSSMSGRVTPSSGRVTPSLSNGRITPSSISGSQRPLKTPTNKGKGSSLSDKITAGSRASKYMTMTAAQLASRNQTPSVNNLDLDGSNASILSPTIFPTLSTSPDRPPLTPFTTPKPSNVHPYNRGATSPTHTSFQSRISTNAPRPRVPSAVAMPPPPSAQSTLFEVDHLQGDVATRNVSPTQVGLSNRPRQISIPFPSSSRPTSSASIRSYGTEEPTIVEQLQSRLEAVEYENERLRAAVDTDPKEAIFLQQISHLQELHQETQAKLDDMERKSSFLQDEVESRRCAADAMQISNQALLAQIDELSSQVQTEVARHQSDVEIHSHKLNVFQDQVEDLNSVIKQKDETIKIQASNIEELTAKVDKAHNDSKKERDELIAQIDELRIAGQETIALYEERLSAATSRRYDLESYITTLEINLATSPDNLPAPTTHQVSSATEIDNETLRDQVQHLQKRCAKLEEQLEDSRATMERDVNSYQEKMSRIRLEDEQRRRDLISKTKEVEQLLKSEAFARNRVEEVEEALRESTLTLENTRGELESLRAELTNLESMIDDASDGDISSKLATFTKKVSSDKLKYEENIRRLEQVLIEASSEKEELIRELSSYPKDGSLTSSETVDTLWDQNNELRQQIAELTSKLVTYANLDTGEDDSPHKAMDRDSSLINRLSGGSKPSIKVDTSTAEVAGLKHIIQDLQKENLLASQKVKHLQSENTILTSEMQQLRKEMEVLEENLEKGLGEETVPNSMPSRERRGEIGVVNQYNDSRLQLEADLDQMRKRLSEGDMKHARIVHDLNKEISELEALVEAKIYREDELEQELEKLKDKLSRQKKTSKNGNENPDARNRLSTASSNISAGRNEEVEVCEICERPGHDIFNCSLLKDDSGSTKKELVICEDCEEAGHVAADCPHSLDVF